MMPWLRLELANWSTPNVVNEAVRDVVKCDTGQLNPGSRREAWLARQASVTNIEGVLGFLILLQM